MTKNVQSKAEGLKRNITPPLEKCLEMSHSKGQEEAHAQSIGSEDTSYSEISSFGGFQWTDSEAFSTVSTREEASRKRKGPPYRKINRYFKSKKQYWRERNRRKQARQLNREGYTYRQIAEKLGVSERTIQRDISKAKSYRKGQINKMIKEFQEEQQKELQRQMEGMSPIEQFRFVTKKFIENRKLIEAREYHKRTLTFTIDLDEILRSLDGQHYGRPFMTFSPKIVNCSLGDLRLKFQFKKGAQVIPYSTLAFR